MKRLVTAVAILGMMFTSACGRGKRSNEEQTLIRHYKTKLTFVEQGTGKTGHIKWNEGERLVIGRTYMANFTVRHNPEAIGTASEITVEKAEFKVTKDRVDDFTEIRYSSSNNDLDYSFEYTPGASANHTRVLKFDGIINGKAEEGTYKIYVE